MTVIELPEAPPEPRPEPKRDRWGRYIIPHPETGKPQGWVRATTLAKTLSDTWGITKWELRMQAVGLAKRADLLAQVASITDPETKDNKRTLNRLAEEAKDAGGASIRRNLGTALHAFAEHLDAGRDITIPEAHRADMEAYRQATEGLHFPPEHIEQICIVPSLGVAGTFDRLARLPDGRLVVADLKTGSTIHYGILEIAIQLALYANATHTYDPATGELAPMPAIDKSVGVIMHLPAGSGECTLHEVDLEAGWEAAQIAQVVRTWRKRDDLSAPLDLNTTATPKKKETVDDGKVADVPFPDEAPADRDEWITGRIRTLGASTAARDLLHTTWPTGVPKKGPWTVEQHTQIVPILDDIETKVRAPFPHNDPAAKPAPSPIDAMNQVPDRTDPPIPTVDPSAAVPPWEMPDNGNEADPDHLEAVIAAHRALPPDPKALAEAWAAQAQAAGTRFGRTTGDDPWTHRGVLITQAAIRCAQALWDDTDPDLLTRAALSIVWGEPIQPGWPTGVVLAHLDIDQATQLEDLAARYQAGDDKALTDIGEAITQLG